MKHRLSITLDESTMLAIQDKLRSASRKGIFRNKSRFVEFAIRKFLEEENA